MKTEHLLRCFYRAVHMLTYSAALVAASAHSAEYALSPDGNAVIRLTPSASLGSAGFDASLLTSAYAGWTVNKAPAVAGGGITTNTYEAAWGSPTGGGAQFVANYSQANAVAAGSRLHYVQIISTNLPLGGSTSPYIDPRPNDDNLPFYWTTAEQAANATSKTVAFSDFSKRDSSELSSTNPITWNANLYQVEHDGNTTVTVRNGVTWGWTMKPATVGSANGTFVNPAPTCPPATCSGLGSGTVSWGIGEPGSLSFAGGPFAPKTSDMFKLGTLTYHNGATQGNSALDGVGLDIAMALSNIAESNFTYHTRLAITNTPNTDDPIASADFVSFVGGSFPNTFNVLEGATATVDLMAKLTPTLAVVAGAVGDKDPDGLAIPSSLGFQVELLGFANPSSGGFVSTVPAPMSALVLLFGVGSLALRMRSHRLG